jgi:RimJ/RimL family protein N-acetyltransferase
MGDVSKRPGSTSLAAMPSLPLPEGLARDGVALRRLRGRDAAPFAAAFREDPRLGALVGVERDPTEASARRFITSLMRLRVRGEYLAVAVSDAPRGPFLGLVMLHSFAWPHRRAELGYWLVPAARGRGVGRAAVSLLADWAFAKLQLDRLEITTTPDNAAALALARSLGFEWEGVMRSRNFERGRPVDVVMLARLRRDFYEAL